MLVPSRWGSFRSVHVHVLNSLSLVWRSVMFLVRVSIWLLTVVSCSAKKVSAKVADLTGVSRSLNPSVSSTWIGVGEV